MQNCCTTLTLPGRESNSATVLHGRVDKSRVFTAPARAFDSATVFNERDH